MSPEEAALYGFNVRVPQSPTHPPPAHMLQETAGIYSSASASGTAVVPNPPAVPTSFTMQYPTAKATPEGTVFSPVAPPWAPKAATHPPEPIHPPVPKAPHLPAEDAGHPISVAEQHTAITTAGSKAAGHPAEPEAIAVDGGDLLPAQPRPEATADLGGADARLDATVQPLEPEPEARVQEVPAATEVAATEVAEAQNIEPGESDSDMDHLDFALYKAKRYLLDAVAAFDRLDTLRDRRRRRVCGFVLLILFVLVDVTRFTICDTLRPAGHIQLPRVPPRRDAAHEAIAGS